MKYSHVANSLSLANGNKKPKKSNVMPLNNMVSGAKYNIVSFCIS